MGGGVNAGGGDPTLVSKTLTLLWGWGGDADQSVLALTQLENTPKSRRSKGRVADGAFVGRGESDKMLWGCRVLGLGGVTGGTKEQGAFPGSLAPPPLRTVSSPGNVSCLSKQTATFAPPGALEGDWAWAPWSETHPGTLQTFLLLEIRIIFLSKLQNEALPPDERRT